MEGLPPTSDIKMIDIWLILCQLVPFFQVVLLTVIEYLREEKKEEKEVEIETVLQVQRGETKGPDPKKVDLDARDEPKPQEAWVPMNTKPDEANTMQKLLTIVRLLLYL